MKGSLRQFATPIFRPIKRSVRMGIRGCRIVTSGQRMSPDFIIIGGQRCGTTSLYRYLSQHPDVRPSPKKEIRFFDYQYDKGMTWYRSHFPLRSSRRLTSHQRERWLTGEATPDYMIHPKAAENLNRELPNVKIIALLRNPVDRAYSHYLHHHVTHRVEPLSFEEAINQEERRLAGELDRILQDPAYYSYQLQMFSYLYRGRYVDHLKQWFKQFEKNQFLILESENFFAQPHSTYQQVLNFLDLPPFAVPLYVKHNSNRIAKMKTLTRKRLMDYFSPHNQRLRDYLGRDFGWTS